MRILTFNCHESYLSALARLGGPMEVVVDLPGHHVTGWDERMRPVPPNVRLIGLADLADAARRADCLVVHNLTELLATKHLALPRVLVLHTSLLGRIAQEGSNLDPAEVARVVHQYVTVTGGVLLAVSEMKRASWGVPCRVVPLCADPADYGPWEGEVASGLRVANHVTQKVRYLRWELHEEVFRDLPCRLVGVNPDRPGVAPAAGWEELKALYRQHRFFVHTAAPGLEDGYNTATLEAMAAGMPVVTNAHPTTPIQDGVSGIVSDDPEVLREGVRRLLACPETARRMGAAARRAVQQRFSPRQFLNGWRAALADARDRWRRHPRGAAARR